MKTEEVVYKAHKLTDTNCKLSVGCIPATSIQPSSSNSTFVYELMHESNHRCWKYSCVPVLFNTAPAGPKPSAYETQGTFQMYSTTGFSEPLVTIMKNI